MRARLPSKYFRSAIITWSHRPAFFRSATRYSFTTVNSPERFDFTNRFWKVGSIDADTPTILAMVAVGAMAMQLELRMPWRWMRARSARSEEHTSELQSPCNLVCRLLLEKKK